LSLADLARPGTAHLGGSEVAALDDSQRVHQLGLESLRAPAVVGQTRERADSGKIALVDAVVGLEPPDRGDDRARHPEALLDALERAGELLELARTDAHAVARDHARGELFEGLAEHALLAIARDHFLVVGDAVERAEPALGDAGGGRL